MKKSLSLNSIIAGTILFSQVRVNFNLLLLMIRGKLDLDLKPLDSRDCDLAEAVKDKVVTPFVRS